MKIIIKRIDIILVGIAVAALVAFVIYNVQEHGIHCM
jgi:hypothetical protein